MIWRRMTSAPRDGRAILVWDGLPFVVRWKGNDFVTPDGDAVRYATHWKGIYQPLWQRVCNAYMKWQARRFMAQFKRARK